MNDLSLVVTILRFGFLALMWIMVFSVVAAMRRDLVIGRKAKVGDQQHVRPESTRTAGRGTAGQGAGATTRGHRRPACRHHAGAGRHTHSVGPCPGSHVGS